MLTFLGVNDSLRAETTMNNNYSVALKNQKAIHFDGLDFNLAIKHVKGDGSRKIAIFSEIDCVYCRYLERDELSKVDNVTAYTFLFTNQAKNSLAWRKSESIYCQIILS
jgi:thiol:disulfide interchange protein DsbC